MLHVETFKKERTVLRTSLTKTKKRIEEELEKSNDDRLTSLMVQRFDELSVKDNAIAEIMSKEESVTTDDLEEEQDRVDDYVL